MGRLTCAVDLGLHLGRTPPRGDLPAKDKAPPPRPIPPPRANLTPEPARYLPPLAPVPP